MTRIKRIEFQHFKALRRFTLNVEHMNVLTGANNAGKSTVISALRVLAVAHRQVWNKRPERLSTPIGRRYGFVITESLLPISLENVATDYDDSQTSRVTFILSNGCSLILFMHPEEGCRLVPESPDVEIDSSARFKANFPLSLAIVPVLGPVEHEEMVVEELTVNRAASPPRAARHFRNYWYYNPEGFADFAATVAQTWPGLTMERPTMADRKLTLFVSEGRMIRELYWVGFGFQIWCQLLTHLHRAAGASLVVIDEPEVYLHPDIQRRLLDVLATLGPDVLIATHSTEIIAEADPTDIVVIDKTRGRGERVTDALGVQKAMDALGSQQNLTLAALARNRRVLFVEGDSDFLLIRRFARRLGYADLGAGLGLTHANSGGFGSNDRVRILAEGIEQALAMRLMIGAVYDRDYFCDEQIESVEAGLNNSLALGCILPCKEIENFLLVPGALQRALLRALADRQDGVEALNMTAELDAIINEMRDDTSDAITAKYQDWFARAGADRQTQVREARRRFNERWQTLEGRLLMVPGKEVLRRLRERVARAHRLTLTDTRIIDAMHLDEIAPTLTALIGRIEAFRTAPVA